MDRIIRQIKCECGNDMDPRANSCRECKTKSKKHKRDYCQCGNGKDARAKSCDLCHLAKLHSSEIYHNRKQKLPPFRALYNHLIRSQTHRKKKVDVTLTFDEFLKYTKIESCYYCGEHIKWHPHRKSKVNTAYNLDRKDNTKGYSYDNCVVCCKECNMLKSNRNDDVFLERIKKISNHLKSW